MNKPTIRVVARAIAKPDKEAELRSVLTGLLEATRKEAGCIHYELLQNNANPTEFAFVEERENDQAVDAHLSASHVQNAMARFPDLLVTDLDLQRYSLVSA